MGKIVLTNLNIDVACEQILNVCQENAIPVSPDSEATLRRNILHYFTSRDFIDRMIYDEVKFYLVDGHRGTIATIRSKKPGVAICFKAVIDLRTMQVVVYSNCKSSVELFFKGMGHAYASMFLGPAIMISAAAKTSKSKRKKKYECFTGIPKKKSEEVPFCIHSSTY